MARPAEARGSHGYSTRPLEGRVHVTLRAAIPIRFACATHSASVFAPYNSGFRGKNTASHCREKHLEFQVGLYR
jgi:hypothetical protein